MKANHWVGGIISSCLVLMGFVSGMATGQGEVAQPAAAPQVPTGTVFTYQGRLTFDNKPVEDDCLMLFKLYDAASAGKQVGPTFSPPAAVPVTAGLFVVEMDFGNVFTGLALWLDTSVQCSGDSSYVSLGRQKLTAVPYAVNSDLLGGNASTHFLNAGNLNSGTLSTDRYSALADLGAEGYLGNASGDLAQNNGTLQTNLNAQMLDGVQGGVYERAYMDGIVPGLATQIIEIPHYYPFTLQLASGQPHFGGVAYITGMENDYTVTITYVVYNGLTGTSKYGGATCSLDGTDILLEFGSITESGFNYVYQLKCPGARIYPPTLVLVATNTYIELRYKLIY